MKISDYFSKMRSNILEDSQTFFRVSKKKLNFLNELCKLRN
jgi:hypothetical protein